MSLQNGLQEQIRRLCDSELFRQSPRLVELLEFLGRATIAGDPLKESLIGVEHFGREANYDPRADPTVRTEIRRLRLKLAEYYASEGAADSFRVEIPKGSYRLELRAVKVPSAPTGLALSRYAGRGVILSIAAAAATLTAGFLVWRMPIHRASASASLKYESKDPSVQDLYSQGRQLWRTRQEPNVRKAIRLFQQCTVRDPNFVWPYLGLADSYAMLAANSLAKPADVLPKAESATLRAIELAPDLAEAHLSLGYVRYCQWDWKSAEREYAKARRLNPGISLAFFRSAVVSMAFGRFDEALSLLRQAQVIDPYSPLVAGAISEAYYYKRDYRRAVEAARKLAALDPAASHFFLAKALWRMGDFGGAKAEWMRVLETPGTPFENRLRAVWSNLDKPAIAHSALEAVLKNPGADVSPWQLAVTAADLHETDAAWKWLDKAVELRQPDVVSIQWDPAFDAMRGEPRYREVLARIGMTPDPNAVAANQRIAGER